MTRVARARGLIVAPPTARRAQISNMSPYNSTGIVVSANGGAVYVGSGGNWLLVANAP